MGAPTAIIVGHSFVKRFSRWIGSHHKMAPKNALELNDRLKEINFLGVSGLFTSQLHEGDLVFQAAQHDIVIIDCGSNDLSDDISISKIVNNVFLFARRCLAEGAAVVFVMSVLPRTRRLKGTVEQFQDKVKQLNDSLKKICVPESKISFYRQSGFSAIPMNQWSDDGIHPSTRRTQAEVKSGMEKYSLSIKTALHRAMHRHRYLQQS